MAEEVSYESFFQIKLMIVERIAETGNGNEDDLNHILIVYLGEQFLSFIIFETLYFLRSGFIHVSFHIKLMIVL
jgi:hypothetical protein